MNTRIVNIFKISHDIDLRKWSICLEHMSSSAITFLKVYLKRITGRKWSISIILKKVSFYCGAQMEYMPSACQARFQICKWARFICANMQISVLHWSTTFKSTTFESIYFWKRIFEEKIKKIIVSNNMCSICATLKFQGGIEPQSPDPWASTLPLSYVPNWDLSVSKLKYIQNNSWFLFS